ncbi:tektin-B1 [Pseudomyrmex gracilis]|uniref:tektin-B1 n=1 Tax=Pseudomyrmex gracilis TaxID=219809 RepID=UPI0009957779|nr:tektin-B1 [Pseudomyrmex gracilis]
MAKFVNYYEKPISHISLPDWYAKQWELQQNANVRRSEACQLRNSSRSARSEANVKIKWDTYLNNSRLADRVTELSNWKDVFENLLQKLSNEMCLLNNEKATTEKDIESINHPLQIANKCISIRDCRRKTELTYDEADVELKKELCMIAKIQETFTQRVHDAWEKLNSLESIRYKLNVDIEDKNKSIGIDRDNLEMDHTSANLSHKPTTSSTGKMNSITHEIWLDQCLSTKMLLENELHDCYTFREAMRVMRECAWNDIRGQQEATDYILRKRIYQTQKTKNELEWQKLKVQKEIEMIDKEMNQLEEMLASKINVLKCAETRLENRVYRSGSELCKDEVELGLKNEVLSFKQTEEDLIKILEHVKSSHNSLKSLLARIDKDLEDKQHSLNTDVVCLDTRSSLKTGNKSELTNETDRNIVLTRMEKEIPMES